MAVIAVGKGFILPAVAIAEVAAVGDRYGNCGAVSIGDLIPANLFQRNPGDSVVFFIGGVAEFDAVAEPIHPKFGHFLGR